MFMTFISLLEIFKIYLLKMGKTKIALIQMKMTSDPNKNKNYAYSCHHFSPPDRKVPEPEVLAEDKAM